MKKATNKLVLTSILVSLLVPLATRPVVLSDNSAGAEQNRSTEAVNVGVIVDYERWVGKMGLSCIEMALSELYASHGRYYKTRLVIHTRDSKKDVIGAAAAALDLIKNVEVQAIIGPVQSTQASFVVDLGEKAKVPIISYSATSSSLSNRSSYFFQATQEQTSQVKVISSIIQAYGWKQVVPIYVNNAYGEGLIPFLNDALQDFGARLPYRSVISTSASDDQILKELYRLMTMQTRVFVVHTDITLGARIFTKAKEIGMMEQGYVWIMTNVMTNFLSSFDSSVIDSMQGVIGIKTSVPETKALNDFRARWKQNFQQKNAKAYDVELNVYGLRAYDAAKALAIAVEKVWTNETFTAVRNISSTTFSGNSTGFGIGVSQNGPELHKSLSEVRFKGLAGDFNLVNGQLHSTTFEIINVINGERRVGFWKPETGLVKSLETETSTDDVIPVTSKPNLESVIWPGKSTSVPKGWEIPTNRKKLKIGVPKKEGFEEFVGVKRDPVTNISTVTGFCIDVFEAVMKALPYSVDYDFIPFEKPDGKTTAGTYDDLVDQVYLGKFDAVVGDTTITANRSLYVDFTLPYTESGVSMIVPVRDTRSKNAWVFLKPLTRDLWVTSACFFVFIGFVVWVLEHRINEDFRGPASYQIGTSFWFSFSTMVFAHKERVISNLARFVVVVWVFVVLILTQSYTASLTSLLTVQQLQPTITDVKQLIMNNESVGYIDGSFVHGILLKHLGFSQSQLRIYKSPEECDELFSKKKADGGIAAAFDEYPYMKFLLARYCSKYTLLEPTFKTGGFGFVFPKGSPLVSDVSRAILTVTEEKTMKNIENKWFGSQTSCPDPNTQVSSNSLGLESFWGLFLIVGIASLSALVIYVATFLYEHRQVLFSSDTPEVPIWRRIRLVLRTFDQKDLSSHTFRKGISQSGDKRTHQDVVDAVEGSSPGSNVTHPSPSSYSNCTNEISDIFACCEDQQETCFTECNTEALSQAPPALEITHELNQETLRTH
ncbi:Ionotropic glutamate receptor [Trema orientale]|uniref:Ionotropic glutamate receptor n=1 Tax=Trema orientale TaxID=63057 RepID=A0A2P5EV77_TREOI|nr:Ionotropic glutamate receptor [Trema orientale]